VTGTPLVITGPGTLYGAQKISGDLNLLARYVRCRFTPNLSAAGVDTAALAAVAIFGGADELPQAAA
jgi:hypothetical protein